MEGQHVCVMFVSQTSELVGERPSDTILGMKTHHMSVSRTLDDPCSLLVIQRVETCLYPEGQRTD